MRFSIIIVACIGILTVASSAPAKDRKKLDTQAMIENYRALATPGEHHKMLAELEGTWTTHTKSWMDPQNPPMESDGTCEMRMILDGRFLQQECTGEMMGRPFTGIGTAGYENETKTYVTTWKSTMGTNLFVMHGTRSVDGKSITLRGDHADPHEGIMKHRAVWKFPDANTQIFEMYGTGKRGKDMKMVEIRYERKQ